MKPSRRYWWGWAILTVCLAALAYSLWPDRRVNVLLITVDSLRPDRLPAYGYTAGYTPNIDQIAVAGVLFRRAFCDVPWSTASMASTFTGRYSIHHGLVTPYQRLDDSETTLAEILAAHGYQTAAVAGFFRLDHIFNLSQGFQSYDDRYDDVMIRLPITPARTPSVFHSDIDANRVFQGRKMESYSFRTDVGVADSAIGWLRRASRNRPFFLWVSFFGPHQKQISGEPIGQALDRYLRVYDGDVSNVDGQIGRILQEIDRDGALGRTLIVFHGDQGQSLLEHGSFGHGQNLYDPSLHVPLLMCLPGRLPAGRQSGALARNVDIMPTVLDLLGIKPPPGLDGHSLKPSATGQTDEGDGTDTFSQTLLSASVYKAIPVAAADGSTQRIGFRRRGFRTASWMYIISEPHRIIDRTHPPALPNDAEKRYTTEELYDLKADPGERRNVIAEHPDVAQRMRNGLRAIVAGGSSGAGRSRANALASGAEEGRGDS